jgi:hypothetical protein
MLLRCVHLAGIIATVVEEEMEHILDRVL